MLLGRNDEALAHLEKLMADGHRAGWWRVLERSPAYASLREAPGFQTILADTRSWLESQRRQLREMRQRGEIPPRSAPALPGGC